MLNNTETLLKIWEGLNSELSELYRRLAWERAKGYERRETVEAIEKTEKAEHAAWLAYRAAEDAAA